jgi:colanic acid/amylovoran biosynthesis glycosyltransferase
MTRIAYLTNEFPSPLEPYVIEEIRELRRRGVEVIPCSAKRVKLEGGEDAEAIVAETCYLPPFRLGLLVRAAALCLRKFTLLAEPVGRVLLRGNESVTRRVRTLLHTWLGAYYALLLEDRGVEHIHVHHGYFASWIAMVAARLSGASYSVTLHGSDLLLHAVCLDTKLKNCKFCFTVSEFNRRHILDHYPDVAPDKIIVQRMGVDRCVSTLHCTAEPRSRELIMLAVGRLHPVKDHAFLVRACRRLKERNFPFLCLIAGEGPEARPLARLIHELALQGEVRLLGHLSRQRLDSYYAACDLVVLTSRSEGIPLVLMEAMAHGRLVLAPAMTGIPELVVNGGTGFLYRAGSLEDFVARVEAIPNLEPTLKPLRQAARQHVLRHFNREKNLAAFADLFLKRLARTAETNAHEDPLLQQI